MFTAGQISIFACVGTGFPGVRVQMVAVVSARNLGLHIRYIPIFENQFASIP
jgi:hypothetical protein